MDIKTFREKLEQRKQALQREMLSLIQAFEQETGCCVDQIRLTDHTRRMGIKKYVRQTVGVDVRLDVFGDGNA